MINNALKTVLEKMLFTRKDTSKLKNMRLFS